MQPFMELSKQVVSLELAKKLKELGVKQESLFWWRMLTKEDGWEIWDSPSDAGGYECFSAFTVAELGEMLPEVLKDDEGIRFNLNIWKDSDVWYVSYWWEEDTRRSSDMKIETFFEYTEADARAKMLIYLVENGLFHKSS